MTRTFGDEMAPNLPVRRIGRADQRVETQRDGSLSYRCIEGLDNQKASGAQMICVGPSDSSVESKFVLQNATIGLHADAVGD